MPSSRKNFRTDRATKALVATLCIAAVLSARGSKKDDEEMRWDKAEGEVGQERYSIAYVDSVTRAKGVDHKDLVGPSKALPFKREKLVFDGGWGFLRAGFAILSIDPDSVDSGKINITGKVVTNNFVSAFYKVRDYVHSHNDARTLYPLFFEQHVQEGRYRDHRWTLFDHAGKKLYYKYKKGELESDIESGIHNYLSILYELRTMDLKVGKTYTLRCYYHRKDYPIKFKVRKTERVRVEAGEFKCLKVEPILRGEGRGFTRKDKIYVWLTDDKRKMPVMIKAKVNIGSLSADLQYFESEPVSPAIKLNALPAN